LKFLFWNTGKREPLNEIAELAEHLRPDVLIFAECPISPVKIVERLNSGYRARFHLPLSPARRFTFVAALPPRSFTPLYDGSGISIRHLRPPLGADALMVTLHLPSKLYLSADDQSLLATRVRQLIQRFETKVGHRRTIVIGDFNMNPFEAGLVSSEGFHAMMSRAIVANGGRTVAGEERAYFFTIPCGPC
jgi:hypothetical protein